MAFGVLRDLLSRRVPQILGLYLGACWVIIEFVNFLVDRFALSPHLIVFSLVTLGSLIPTVLLLAYFHGLPGRNDWATAEKIGIPVNLLGAAALVGFMFSDKHLGAATTTVRLETEEGRSIERVIPKSEFRKKVALFYFDNESGDDTLDWLQAGLAFGLLMDLTQDLYIHFGDYHRMHERLESAGYADGVGLPRTLKANLAQQIQRDYFIDGSFDRDGEEVTVTAAVYETRRQKLLARRDFTGDDILSLLDRISVQVRRDLGIPDRHIEETADLRVADLLSHSREAFRLLAESYDKLFRSDWEGLRDRMERAVEADPTSAFAHYLLSFAYLISNRTEDAEREARRTMEYIYRLPEPWQYYVKLYYYEAIEPDAAKRFAVAKMMVDLFPEDIDARTHLGWEYEQRHQVEKAIAEYERVLEIDPGQHEYLKRIGYAYRGAGRYDRALEYFQRYAEAQPRDYSAFQALADAYGSQGEHERAESYYEQALIVDPDNVEVLGRLGAVAFNMGRFAESLRLSERALEVARSSQERATAYRWLSDHYRWRHQIAKAIEYREREWAEREKHMPRTMVVANYVLSDLDLYASAGRAERAFEIIGVAESELGPPFDVAIPGAYLDVYLALDDAERAEPRLAEVEAAMQEVAAGWVLDDLQAAHGWIHELRGEYEQAVERYRRALQLEPLDVSRHRFMGRSYRMLGRLDDAEAALLANLKVTPYDPGAHYEIALVYADMGDEARALQHLRTAVEVLQDADPTCQTAQKVQAKLAELERT